MSYVNVCLSSCLSTIFCHGVMVSSVVSDIWSFPVLRSLRLELLKQGVCWDLPCVFQTPLVVGTMLCLVQIQTCKREKDFCRNRILASRLIICRFLLTFLLILVIHVGKFLCNLWHRQIFCYDLKLMGSTFLLGRRNVHGLFRCTQCFQDSPCHQSYSISAIANT